MRLCPRVSLLVSHNSFWQLISLHLPQTLDSGRFDTATRSYSLTRRSRGQSRDTAKRYHSNPRSLIRHHSSTLHPPRYVSRSQSARVSAFKPLTFTAHGNPGARYHHHDGQVPLFGGDDGYDPDDYHEGGLMRASSSALCRPHISSRVAARVSWYEEERGPPPVRVAHALHVQITFCTCRSLSARADMVYWRVMLLSF